MCEGERMCVRESVFEGGRGCVREGEGVCKEGEGRWSRLCDLFIMAYMFHSAECAWTRMTAPSNNH